MPKMKDDKYNINDGMNQKTCPEVRESKGVRRYQRDEVEMGEVAVRDETTEEAAGESDVKTDDVGQDRE